jgi:hypothetical protein
MGRHSEHQRGPRCRTNSVDEHPVLFLAHSMSWTNVVSPSRCCFLARHAKDLVRGCGSPALITLVCLPRSV